MNVSQVASKNFNDIFQTRHKMCDLRGVKMELHFSDDNMCDLPIQTSVSNSK